MKLTIAKKTKLLAQRGFTLIELAIVGLFLGLLAIFTVSQFTGGATDTTKANGMYAAANKLAENWSLIAMQCGTTTDIATSPIGDSASPTANENLAVLMGTSAPIATYTACYNQSGVKPLQGLGVGSATAGFKIHDYPFTATVTAGRTLNIAYTGVPANIFQALYSKYSASASATPTPAATATDSADTQIRYGAQAADGSRTVTLLKAF